MKKIEWVDIFSDRPPYGDPVILCINGVVQNITYMLDGSDDCEDWFEPFHFSHDEEIKIKWSLASHWAKLPGPPSTR